MNAFINTRTYFSLIFVLLFVASCATQTNRVVEKLADDLKIETKKEILGNAETALKKAELDWLKSGDIRQRNNLLLSAAQDFQTAGECIRTDIIIANIEGFLEDRLQQQYASLLKAECALIQHYASGIPAELINPPIETMIAWLTPITDNQFLDRKEVLIAHLAALQERWDFATNVLSQQLNSSSPLNQAQEQVLWLWFLNASKASQTALGNANPFMRAYMSLSNILEDEGLTDTSRQQAIMFWQKQHPTHPLSINLPADVRDYMGQKIKEVSNIAVLLPLSGRIQVQGDAIRQGIMSAYFERLNSINSTNPGQMIPSITFLDTGSDSSGFKSAEITPEGLMQFDIVIGPLLREHVNLIKTFNLPESMLVYLNRVPNDSNTKRFELINSSFEGSVKDELGASMQSKELDADPMVELKTTTESISTADSSAAVDLNLVSNSNARVYFALAPEDEAIQLANLMHERGVKTPIIISNGSSVSTRMVSVFTQQWIALNGLEEATLPKTVTFSDNKGLRVGITDALGVLQSQQRINQVSNLSTEVVHNVTRNRRDVDAFAVFALPQQVELLNPIIEASISLFTERTIPVFATSYSYQHQLNKNSIRDLRNLVFVDMPFLMPTQRSGKLAAQVDLIWNNPPSSFLRLFAFGYDAFQFSEQMQQLAYFSQTELQGLTGKLSVNNQKEVIRGLPNAVIQQDSIIQSQAF